jgi:sn-glycerol 3-phosphate transport system ATP-binding protein
MLSAEIDLVEPLGADTLAYGHLDGDGARIAARLPASFAARAGRLALRYQQADVHYFDAGTGARLD